MKEPVTYAKDTDSGQTSYPGEYLHYERRHRLDNSQREVKVCTRGYRGTHMKQSYDEMVWKKVPLMCVCYIQCVYGHR